MCTRYISSDKKKFVGVRVHVRVRVRVRVCQRDSCMDEMQELRRELYLHTLGAAGVCVPPPPFFFHPCTGLRRELCLLHSLGAAGVWMCGCVSVRVYAARQRRCVCVCMCVCSPLYYR